MILVLNCGSSSLKFCLFDNDFNEGIKGNFERIGVAGSFVSVNNNGIKDKYEQEFKTHKDCIVFLFDKFSNVYGIDVNAIKIIGHRVVHGGSFPGAVLVDDDILTQMDKISELAPLHNPSQMVVVRACRELFPNIKNSLSFDTAYHSTIPDYAYTYGLPIDLIEKHKIRRYGFHGLSHEFVMKEFCDKNNKKEEDVNIITCHLGSGCSVCAIKNGKSIDTSMGFTPLEGLVMGTRTGDMDPSIVSFISEKEGLTPKEVDNLINKKSGLVGLTGLSNVDMREVLYLGGYPVSDFDGSYLKDKFSTEELEVLAKRCKLAIGVFTYRVKKYIGSYFAILNGKVDAIVFMAGVGERSAAIRDLITKDLEILKNIPIEVIPTNEEKMIAEEAYQFIK